jgi:hypothetical protein
MLREKIVKAMAVAMAMAMAMAKLMVMKITLAMAMAVAMAMAKLMVMKMTFGYGYGHGYVNGDGDVYGDGGSSGGGDGTEKYKQASLCPNPSLGKISTNQNHRLNNYCCRIRTRNNSVLMQLRFYINYGFQPAHTAGFVQTMCY